MREKKGPVHFLTDLNDGRSNLRPIDVLIYDRSKGEHACVDVTGVSPTIGNRGFDVGEAVKNVEATG